MSDAQQAQVASPPAAEEPGLWAPPRGEPGLDGADLAAWRSAVADLRALAGEARLSKLEVARRAAVPIGTLSPWYDGSYTGRYDAVTERVRRFPAAHAEARAARLALPAAPDFVPTPTARRLTEALACAQTMPEIAVATLGAGCGKTTTARAYVAARPNAWLVTMRPSTAGRHPMLCELALALDVTESNPARLDRALGARLRRNGRNTLLILDEAQHLSDDAVNQLRYFNDEYGTGLALLGNEAVFRRWGGPQEKAARDGFAQIQSRIGYRIQRRQPLPGDTEALLDAWGLKDEEVRRLCVTISRRDGALRLVDKSIKLAAMIAAGEGREIAAADLRAAWANRTAGEAGA